MTNEGTESLLLHRHLQDLRCFEPDSGTQFEYAFDDIGNRKVSRNGGDQTGDNLRETSYTANRLNQYSSRTTPASADVIGMARGNAVTVKLNGTSVGAPYRKGEYFGKKVYSASTGGTLLLQEKYLYDGWNLVAVLDGANVLQKSFLWGTDLSGSMQGAGGVGGLITFTKHAAPSTGTWFAAFDGNGNLGALVSAADGSVQATYEYGPFGEVIRATGANAKANPFRFSTKFQDDETDLVYYGYRFYSAATGRWLSRDPIQERGGKNLYGFVENDPTHGLDLLGLVFAAIDGTDSATSVHFDLASRNWNSHVRSMYAKYTGADARRYFQGPNTLGMNSGEITAQVYNFICSEVQRDPSQPVYMIGHSRGGAIAIDVARLLKDRGCECGRGAIRVSFLGLFDAVDRSSMLNAGGIPENVNLTYHARRAPSAGSRDGHGWLLSGTFMNPFIWDQPGGATDSIPFGNTGTFGGIEYEEQFFFGTHSGMGGDPWGGDRPGVLDAGVDARASAEALAYVLEGAMRAGMTFRGLR